MSFHLNFNSLTLFKGPFISTLISWLCSKTMKKKNGKNKRIFYELNTIVEKKVFVCFDIVTILQYSVCWYLWLHIFVSPMHSRRTHPNAEWTLCKVSFSSSQPAQFHDELLILYAWQVWQTCCWTLLSENQTSWGLLLLCLWCPWSKTRPRPVLCWIGHWHDWSHCVSWTKLHFIY